MKSTHPEAVGMRLRKLRLLSGLKQTQLCEALNVSSTTYNHYERGRNRPDLQIATKICRFYGVTLDYLLVGDIQEFNPSFNKLDVFVANEEQYRIIIRMRLRKHRKRAGLIQKDVSDHFAIEATRYRKWETRDNSSLPLFFLLSFCDLVNIEPRDLLKKRLDQEEIIHLLKE